MEKENVYGYISRRRNYDASAVMILEAWLLNNYSYPYLSVNEYDALVTSTGLSKKQISMWFRNYRRRKLNK
ncbi:hypothetical protein ROZALSC1DRAFT_17994 [Rozella allomycis CSF55]|uniref:Homeobox domain-containing protein n=1 Tax=Rozella allomycis (strain CSF55) TaxID=988480 RepID=A0A4P9YA65_ROZAC|nr:hypothetical protein ROZALSC1DRAFT_17994 [Rozella allomycis CSF55]